MITKLKSNNAIFNDVIIFFLIYSGYIKVLFYDYEIIVTYFQYGLLGITLVYSAVKAIQISRWRIISSHWLFIAFAATFFFSRIYTNSIIYSSEKFQNMFLTVIYCLCLYICSYGRDLDSLMKGIARINIIIIFAYAIMNYRDILSAFTGSTRFGNDVGDNPIWVGRFCMDTFFIMLFYHLSGKERVYIWRGIEYAVILLLVFTTGSKANWLALIIGTFVLALIFMSDRKKRQNFIKYLVLILIVTIIVFIFFRHQIMSYLYSRFYFSLIDSPGYRVNMYKYAIKHIPERLWFGHGLGSWAIKYTHLDATSYPHNIFLESMFECGIINTFCLVAFIVVTIKKGFRIEEGKRILFVLFISNFVYSIFSGSLSEGNRGLYLYAVMMVGYYIDEKTKKYYRIIYKAEKLP